MKKSSFSRLALTALALSAVSGVANAKLYYGLGYTHNLESPRGEQFFIDAVRGITDEAKTERLYIDHQYNHESKGGVTGFVGIPIKSNFAIEARYSMFNNWIDHSFAMQEQATRDVLDENDEVVGVEEGISDVRYDFTTKGQKFGLHGVYRHSLNSFLYVKGGIGVTHTMTEGLRGNLTHTFNDEVISAKNNQIYKGYKDSRTDLEGSLGLGVRMTSCCNFEIEYNSSQYQETATASIVWQF